MSIEFFADPTVEEVVTHCFELVTYRSDGSSRRHDTSRFDGVTEPEGDR